MEHVDTGVVVVFALVGALYAACMFAAFRYATARTPAGVVRQLSRTHQPVTVVVSAFHPTAWDPSRPLGTSGFHDWGTATYTLEDPQTVRVRFETRGGTAVEHSGPIPALLLPDTPAMRRRRRIARIVIALYLIFGLATFILTAALVDGSDTFRARVAALVALGVLAISWLATHVVLARKLPRSTVHPHHLAAWTASYLVVSAAFGVFWRLDTLGDPQPIPWASAFLDASVFVLISGAVVAASLHHHNYIHHADDKR